MGFFYNAASLSPRLPKKKKFVKDLMMAAPMGMCPPGVDPDVASEFVKVKCAANEE